MNERAARPEQEWSQRGGGPTDPVERRCGPLLSLKTNPYRVIPTARLSAKFDQDESQCLLRLLEHSRWLGSRHSGLCGDAIVDICWDANARYTDDVKPREMAKTNCAPQDTPLSTLTPTRITEIRDRQFLLYFQKALAGGARSDRAAEEDAQEKLQAWLIRLSKRIKDSLALGALTNHSAQKLRKKRMIRGGRAQRTDCDRELDALRYMRLRVKAGRRTGNPLHAARVRAEDARLRREDCEIALLAPLVRKLSCFQYFANEVRPSRLPKWA